MNLDPAVLTPEACRAGRALLHWGVRDLAKAAGVAPATISRIERGELSNSATKRAVLAAFLDGGVEITNGEYTGARLRLDKTGDEP